MIYKIVLNAAIVIVANWKYIFAEYDSNWNAKPFDYENDFFLFSYFLFAFYKSKLTAWACVEVYKIRLTVALINQIQM